MHYFCACKFSTVYRWLQLSTKKHQSFSLSCVHSPHISLSALPQLKCVLRWKWQTGKTDRVQFWWCSSQQAKIIWGKAGRQYFFLLFTQFCLPVGQSAFTSKLIRRWLPAPSSNPSWHSTALCPARLAWVVTKYTHTHSQSESVQSFGPKSSVIWLKSERLKQKKG